MQKITNKEIQQSEIKEKNSENYSDLVYSAMKMIGVVLLATLTIISLSSIGSTKSYFFDEEISIGNFLQADPLGFNVTINDSTTATVDLSLGEQKVILIMTPNSDSEPIQYFVTASYKDGNIDLCNSIEAVGTFPFPYSGKIVDLKTGTTTSTGSWTMTLSNIGNFSNSTCTIELVYKGWNADVPYGKGFNDTKKVSITFFVPELKTESKSVQTNLVIETPQEESVVESEPEKVIEENSVTENSTETVVTQEVTEEKTEEVKEEVVTGTPAPEAVNGEAPPSETPADTPVVEQVIE